MKKYLILMMLLMATQAGAFDLGFGTPPLPPSFYAQLINNINARGTLTHTRASTANVVSNTGSIVNAPVNTPGFPGLRLSLASVDNAIKGPEIIANGDFSGAFTGNLPAGHSLTGSTTGSDYLAADDVNNRLRIVSSGPSMGVQQNVATIGDYYFYTLNIYSVTSGSLKLAVGSGNGNAPVFTKPGIYSGIIKNSGTDGNIFLIRNAACDITVKSWSVKKVTPAWATSYTNIAAWGDSLTQGPTVGNYPQMIDQESNFAVYNGGISGETSTQIKARMLAQTSKYGDIAVIWAGRNNWFTPVDVKADIAAMVAALTTDHFLVLSVINSATEANPSAAYDIIAQLNSDLSTLYGSKYLDIRSILVSNYNPAYAQDVLDHAADFPPYSLLSDTLHLNTAGYRIVASEVMNKILALGYTNQINLTSQGVLSEPTGTNIFANPVAPVTQSVTVTAVQHVLSFYGTGTVTRSGVSSGALVGTGANNRVQVAFTPTAGSLTLTLAGSVTSPQLEISPTSIASSPALSTAATTVRAATVITGTPIKAYSAGRQWTARGKVTFNSLIAGDNYVWTSYVDASNYTALIVNGTSAILRRRVAGNNIDATATITEPTLGTQYLWSFKVLGDGTSSVGILLRLGYSSCLNFVPSSKTEKCNPSTPSKKRHDWLAFSTSE